MEHPFHKPNLSDITIKTFELGISAAFACGVTNRVPLGYSGDDILLFGSNQPRRKSVVSVRNHSGMAELLITDIGGHFLVLCKYNEALGYQVIAMQFMEAFELVKNFIESEIKNL